MPMNIRRAQSLILAFVALASWPAWAANNLDLSSVVSRDTVELTIYNPEDLTLVRETRRLAFRKGLNPIQFAWSNTLIDPTSVELSFGERDASLSLHDITYPHDKPQMLYWNVQANEDLDAVVEISYFTSGIQWQAEYLAIADSDEKTLDLQGFVSVYNRSGEDYADASVRLVVGEINLVEEIARLARLPVEGVDGLAEAEYAGLRNQAARQKMMPMAPMAASAGASFDFPVEELAPKEVAKEGLGDYFIYTIEGRETIPDQWAKRLNSFEASAIPLKRVYRYRPEEFGDRLMRLYLVENSQQPGAKAGGLGDSPLPQGRYQIMRRTAEGGLEYLTQLEGRYVPIGDELELAIGTDPNLVFELRKIQVRRDNIWQRYKKAKVLKRVDSGQLQVDHDARVAGWDEHESFRYRLVNHTGNPAPLELRLSFDGDARFVSQQSVERHDYRSLEMKLELAPREQRQVDFEVITAKGSNAKQDRLEIGF